MRWTQPVRSLLAAGEGYLDRLLCVVGAILFSQLPEFIQQYLQRLGGHLDEARHQLEQFRAAAAKSNLSLDEFITRTLGSAEPAVARLGGVMRETVARVDELAAAEAAIRQASLFTRPFVFLRHLDFSITRATWSVFRPAVPTTLEGLVYAALGVLLALAFYHGAVKAPVRRALRRRAEQRALAAETPRPGAGGDDRPA